MRMSGFAVSINEASNANLPLILRQFIIAILMSSPLVGFPFLLFKEGRLGFCLEGRWLLTCEGGNVASALVLLLPF